MVVLLRVFARARVAPLLVLFGRAVAEVVPSLAGAPDPTAARSASLVAPLREEGVLATPDFDAAAFEAPDLEAVALAAVARRDAGSAAATDGLSRRSVFGRGSNRAAVGGPTTGARPGNHCGLPDSCGAIQVLGDGAAFQCNDYVL